MAVSPFLSIIFGLILAFFENLVFACRQKNNSNVLVVVGKQYNCDGGGGGGKEKWKDGGSGVGGKIIGGGVT